MGMELELDMDMDGETFGKKMVEVVRDFVKRSTDPLKERAARQEQCMDALLQRITQLEKRLNALDPQPAAAQAVGYERVGEDGGGWTD